MKSEEERVVYVVGAGEKVIGEQSSKLDVMIDGEDAVRGGNVEILSYVVKIRAEKYDMC